MLIKTPPIFSGQREKNKEREKKGGWSIGKSVDKKGKKRDK